VSVLWDFLWPFYWCRLPFSTCLRKPGGIAASAPRVVSACFPVEPRRSKGHKSVVKALVAICRRFYYSEVLLIIFVYYYDLYNRALIIRFVKRDIGGIKWEKATRNLSKVFFLGICYIALFIITVCIIELWWYFLNIFTSADTFLLKYTYCRHFTRYNLQNVKWTRFLGKKWNIYISFKIYSTSRRFQKQNEYFLSEVLDI